MLKTQGHISAAAKIAQDDVRDRVTQIEADAYAAAKENGMTIVELNDEELAAWQAVSQPVIDGYLKLQAIRVNEFLTRSALIKSCLDMIKKLMTGDLIVARYHKI